MDVDGGCGLEMSLLRLVTVICGSVYRIVVDSVRALPAPSVATTVTALRPLASVSTRLQFAEAFPVAVPPLALAPFIVTLLIPLPPLPLSLAVPLKVAVLLETV